VSPALTGALYVLAAELVFATVGSAIRLVSAEIPTEQVVFCRNALGLLALAPLVVRAGTGSLATRNWRSHVYRALWGLAAMYCYFFALARIPLAEAVLLKLTSPIFIPTAAALLLAEPTTPRTRVAVVVGFLGVLLVLRPGGHALTAMALIGLASGLFDALAKVSVRRASRTEPALRIVFYFAAIGAAVSAGPAIVVWRAPQPETWAWLAVIGALATIGQLLLTRGFALAEAARAGPLAYAGVVFAAAYGWVFWDEALHLTTLAGALLIFGAAALVTRRVDLRDFG
jgi:drug/metabolite transporter (DMT)-like permease